jgi:hypothetical protein
MASKCIKVYLNDDLYNFFKDFSQKQNKSLSSGIKDCLKLLADTIESIDGITDNFLAVQVKDNKVLADKPSTEMFEWWDNMEKRLYQKIVSQRKKF